MSDRSRLCRASDIARVRCEGRRMTTPFFSLLAMPGKSQTSRLAVSTPRHLGTAVKRNRMRRRLRAAFQHHLAGPEPVVDLVVHARRPSLETDWSCIMNAVSRGLADVVIQESSSST